MSSNRNRNSHFGNMDHPFQEMSQIMHSFGGFGGSFGGGFGGFSNSLMSDPFGDMMQFSNEHKGIHSSNNGGSYVCQSYVSSSTMGNDGRVKK